MIDLLLDFQGNTPLPANWHQYYGLTDARFAKLLLPEDKSDSFRNKHSETALTLFMLGQLDGWKQVGNLRVVPRDKASRLDQNFFDDIRSATSQLYAVPLSPYTKWNHLPAAPFNQQHLDFSASVLLFEFEVIGKAFNTTKAGEVFRRLSFLELGQRNAWCQYDGFLFLPPNEVGTKGKLIGVEAKLTSDASTNTTDFDHVNQILRNLEAGYWLTHDPASRYSGWEFHYVFICPSEAIEYQSTFYGYALKSPESIKGLLQNYGRLLRGAAVQHRRNDASDEQFDEFCVWAESRIAVLHWRQLATAVEDGNTDYFEKYIAGLRQLDVALADATKKRFEAAGILNRE